MMTIVVPLLTILILAAFGAGCWWTFWWFVFRPIDRAGAAYRQALAEDYVSASSARVSEKNAERTARRSWMDADEEVIRYFRGGTRSEEMKEKCHVHDRHDHRHVAPRHVPRRR